MVRRIVVDASIDVSATAEQTFRWVTDPALVPRWVQDLVESRPASDTEPIREGSRSVEVIQVGRTRMEVPAQVTALVPDRLVENRLEMPDGASTSRVEITDHAGGCAVTLTMEAEVAGMRWLPTPVLSRMLTLRLRGDLRRLKAQVEGG
jgi:uncharacterized protein YndB with AHSA1/START domain